MKLVEAQAAGPASTFFIYKKTLAVVGVLSPTTNVMPGVDPDVGFLLVVGDKTPTTAKICSYIIIE